MSQTQNLKLLKDAPSLKGKRVFLRVDFNVPMKDGNIADDSRIQAALQSISFLQEKEAKIICASHLGRPKGSRVPKFSLEPVAEHLGKSLNCEVLFSHDNTGTAVVRQSKELKNGSLMVLENLRFENAEIENDSAFAAKLAQLCDVYVNDAFGCSHRAHASVAALPQLVEEKYAGFLLTDEIQELTKLIKTPQRPLISVIGGAKVSDKVEVIEALALKSSKILIGGAMAYTFLKHLNVDTGKSMLETDKINLARNIMERAKENHCEIVLPLDHRCTTDFDSKDTPHVTENAHIPEKFMALDIGPRTEKLFEEELQKAASIFWNGPMGVFEKEEFAQGSLSVAASIAKSPAQIKVCGGGDSVAALKKSGLESQFTHISTGGGASLEFLEGKTLPGIESLGRFSRSSS